MAPRNEGPEPETAPMPSADALRTMFAELGGNTADHAVVESRNAHDDHDEMAGAPGSEELSAPPWPPAPTTDMPEDAANGADAMERADTDMGRDDTDAVIVDADEAPHTQETQETPQTIEDLERQFAASGFTPVATRPGLLAEIEREQPQAPEAAPAEVAEAAEPVAETPDRVPSTPVPSGPDPRDYPARLAHARQRRDGGQLDDALNEYRAIIKNAPDLLSEVLSDLRASLEETPDHPNLHSVLGDALVCQGDYESALEEYNRATALAQARNAQP